MITQKIIRKLRNDWTLLDITTRKESAMDVRVKNHVILGPQEDEEMVTITVDGKNAGKSRRDDTGVTDSQRKDHQPLYGKEG